MDTTSSLKSKLECLRTGILADRRAGLRLVVFVTVKANASSGCCEVFDRIPGHARHYRLYTALHRDSYKYGKGEDVFPP